MHEGSASGTLLQRVQMLFSAGTAVGLTDRELLERFLHHGRESGEAAFTALVERHGPMVFRVCNQALGDRHAAEDAFQATFLVLARRARSIRKHDSVASWLFGVACRAAARIRMVEARRQRYDRRGAIVRAHRRIDVAVSSEPWPELHAEVARLPENYRVPILLCYFEGLTHEQAAGRLGWPVGTVKTRLARGREKLRWRLGCRGLQSELLIPAGLLRRSDIPELSRLLLDSTPQAAAGFAAGAGAGRFSSSAVHAITQGVLKDMLINRLKLGAITLFGAAALGLSTMALARQAPRERQADREPQPVSTPEKDSPRPLVLNFPGRTSYIPDMLIRIRPRFDCLINKVLVNVGDRVKRGDPLLEIFSAELAEAKRRYVIAYGRWLVAKEAPDHKDPPVGASKSPPRALVEDQGTEAARQLEMKLAKENLRIHGLTDDEIEHAQSEEGGQRAKMAVRSQLGGVVIRRDVVPGNFYDSNDKLLTIAQDDRLLVYAGIDSREAHKLELGPRVRVTFPYMDRTVNATVDRISQKVSRDTGMVIFWISIPNPDHCLKADMLVRVQLDLRPKALRRRESPTLPLCALRNPIQAWTSDCTKWSENSTCFSTKKPTNPRTQRSWKG